MKFYFEHFLVVLLLTALVAANAAGAVRVAAQVESSGDIYAGEKFTYYVIIDGENKPGQVDLGPLAKYNPQSAGEKNLSQKSITITNNRRTEKITKRYVMIYHLVAAETGTIQIPSVKVTLDGRVYTTNSVSVEVQQPATTGKIDLELTLSKQHCYVGEPIVITVKWFIHPDIVNAVGDFNFNVPVFSSNDFYIEDVDSSGVVPPPNRTVDGVGVYIAQQAAVHKGTDYAQVLFSKVLVAKHSGRIEIAPAVVSVDIAVGRRRGGFFGSQLQYKRFMAKSKPMVLEVTALPDEGKPKGFYGLIGKYTISAIAEPTEVYMGDPITLTIKIGGNKYLKPVKWPKLQEIEGLGENFKIPTEQSSPVIENGFKIFTQTIRANNNDVTQIPPIALVYFDVDRGRFVTATSKAIPLDVMVTKKVTTADMEGMEMVSVNKQVEAIKKGISANYEDTDALVNQDFSITSVLIKPAYAMIWALPFAAFLISALLKSVMYTSDEKLAVRRRRQACGKAVAGLKKISALGDDQKHQMVVSVMKQYIGRRFDRMSGSLTGVDCEQEILEHFGDAEDAKAYREIIESCEAAYYAGRQVKPDRQQLGRIIQLIRRIEKKTKK